MVWEQNCVWLFYLFNFKWNYDFLKSKTLCILLNKNSILIKTKRNWKWKFSHTSSETWTLCFRSFKNRKLTVKLWWVGARERKTRACFVPLNLCFISMHCVLNTLSEYAYCYILKSKSINSYTCCLFLKLLNPFIVSLACLLYLCLINFSIQVFLEF